MRRLSPQWIYRGVLPFLLLFTLSCSLILNSGDGVRQGVNAAFEGCRIYENSETQREDFLISIEREMTNMEPVEEVLTGCIASRRTPDRTELDFTSTLTLEVTNDENRARIRALKYQNVIR